jgi:hypothetical protein
LGVVLLFVALRMTSNEKHDPIASSTPGTETILTMFGDGPFRLTHAEPIRNETDSTIRFVNVMGTCACSHVELQEQEVPAGGETALHFEVEVPENSSGRRLMFFLEQDDGTHRRLDFHVAVFPTLQLPDEVGHVAIGTLQPGDVEQRRLMVYLHAEGEETVPPEILEAVSLDPAIVVEFENSTQWTSLPGNIGTRRVAFLTISASWTPNEGAFTKPVEVVYGQGGATGAVGRKALTVSGHHESVYELSPRRIRVELLPRDGTVDRTVLLRRVDGKELSIQSIDTDSDAIAVVERTVVDGDTCRLRFAINANLFDEILFAECVIRTNHPVQPAVSVPISATKEATQ